MKRIYVKVSVILALLSSQPLFAVTDGFLFNVTTTSGNVLSITTTTPKHVYPRAGIKINSTSFFIRNPGIDCKPISNGYCLFSVSNTKPATIAITGSGALNFTLCLDGTGPLSCQNYNATVQSNPRFAFVGGFGGDTNLSICGIDQTTGGFTVCNYADHTFAEPSSVAFSPSNTLAYVTNFSANTVSICNIDQTTATLSGCTDTPTLFSEPDGIAIFGGFAYVVNFGSDSVSKCTIDLFSGGLSGCVNTGSNFSEPQGVVFNPAHTLVYIGSWDGGTITYCQYDPYTGDFNNCNTAVSGFTYPTGIAFNPAGTIAYVTDFETGVYKCNVNSDGTLSSCTLTGSEFEGPDSIVLNSEGRFAYITDYGSGTFVTQCTVDQTTWELTNCGHTGSGFTSPTGVALYY